MNVAIVETPIVLDALVARVRTDACGAVVAFLGVVRETSPGDDRPVDGIHYEAYPAMALPAMEAIAAEARERFGPLEIAIVHRLGDLRLGEASIGVAVGAPHRGPAFDACEYAMDEIKARVAVWKQERYRGGGTAWRANTVSPLP
ncbi:MAG: molybdenum cofactor biosynthesis protein MoaE [Candidatus Velthaea sp.]